MSRCCARPDGPITPGHGSEGVHASRDVAGQREGVLGPAQAASVDIDGCQHEGNARLYETAGVGSIWYAMANGAGASDRLASSAG